MLSRRAAFSLFGAVALLVSLGIKSLAPNPTLSLDVERSQRELASLLITQGFAVKIVGQRDFEYVQGNRANCNLITRLERSLETQAEFVSATKNLPVLKYRYRGAYLGDFPRGRFDLRNRLELLGLRFGLTRAAEFPLLIAASPGCDLTKIDFGPQLLFKKQGYVPPFRERK